MLTATLNILAIAGSAAFAGAMLCIGVTLGGYWRTLPAEQFLEWFATNNHFISRTIPMVFVPAFIGVAGSIWLAWGTPSLKFWAAAGVCILVVAILTFAFFVPANAAFDSKALSAEETIAKLDQWLSIHNGRIAFAAIASVLGCFAIKV